MKPLAYKADEVLSIAQDKSLSDDEIIRSDFFDGNALKKIKLDNESDAPSRFKLMALQRVMRVYPNRKSAAMLLEKGIDSAAKIISLGRRAFLLEYASLAGLEENQAAIVYSSAVARTTQVLHQFFNLLGSKMPHSQEGCFGAFAAAADEKFGTLPDYQTIFGSQDYAGISEYRSVYSPAAYLTDLLRLVDHYIPQNDLHKRRPELKHLLLNEQNTTTLVPVLDIANYMLENALIVKQLPADYSVSVYQVLQESIWNPPDNVYGPLASATYPFSLPFNLPQFGIETCLNQFGASRALVYQTFNPGFNYDVLSREKLGLSLEQADVISREIKTPEELNPFWGTEKIKGESIDVLDQVDVFRDKTGLSAEELTELLEHDLGDVEIHGPDSQAKPVQSCFFIAQNTDLPENRYLTVAEEPDPEDAKKIRRVLKNCFYPASSQTPSFRLLTWKNLELIHRFIRLARRLQWSFTELDWVLQSACDNKLDPNALRTVALLQERKTRYHLPLDVLCSFWSDMKVTGMGPGPRPQDLYNKIYNPDSLVTDKTVYRPENKYTKLFSTPAFNWFPLKAGDEEMKNKTAWLCGALKLDAESLLILADGIVRRPEDKPESWEIKLDLRTLSRFYGMAMMARTLAVPLADFVWLLKIILPGEMATVDDVAQVEETVRWLKAAGIAIAALRLLLDKELQAKPPRTLSILQMRNFLKSVLAADQPAATPEVRAEVFAKLLADFWSVPVWLTTAKLGTGPDAKSMLDQALDLGRRMDEAGFRETDMYLFFNPFYRCCTLAMLLNITQHQAAVLFAGLRINPDLQWPVLKELLQKRDLIAGINDRNDLLIDYLATPPQSSSEEAAKQLAAFTGWDSAEIRTLCRVWGEAWVPSKVDDIIWLKKCFDMKATLGLDMHTLLDLGAMIALPAEKFEDRYQAEKNIFQRLVKTLLPDSGAEQPAATTAITRTLRAARRSALVAKTLFKQQRKNSRDLCEYFLLDIDSGPELETSLIENAIEAVQLYIHRVRMNLETQAQVKDFPLAPLAILWEWMQNYRVWEANRKVFLYPENYAVPEVRRHGSALYERLQAELQQMDVSDEAMAAALKNYLDGFAEIASLETCGTYVHTLPEDAPIPDAAAKIFYQVGVTKIQPYKHYYRIAEYFRDGDKKTYGDAVWSAWNSLTVDIKSRLVTPVFAFGRLFVFWHEITTKQQITSDSKDGQLMEMKIKHEKVSEAMLYYSFHDFNGRWVVPQVFGDAIQVELDKTKDFKLSASVCHEEKSQEEFICLAYPTAVGMQAYSIDKNLNCQAFKGTIPQEPGPRIRLYISGNFLFLSDHDPCLPAMDIICCYPLDGNDIDLISKKPAPYCHGTWVPDHDQEHQALSLEFDRQDSFRITDKEPMAANPVTIAFWANWHRKAGMCSYLLGEMVVGTKSFSILGEYDCDEILIGWFSGKDKSRFYRFEVTTENQWKFYLVTLMGNLAELYIDGQKIPSADEVGSPFDCDLQHDGTGTKQSLLGLNFCLEGAISKLIVLRKITDENRRFLLESKLNFMVTGRPILKKISADTTLKPIPGQPGWYIFTTSGAEYLAAINYQPAEGFPQDVKVSFSRLNTTVVHPLNQALLSGGVDKLLSLDSQKTPELSFSLLTPVSERIIGHVPSDQLDFSGPLGMYFWEIFFHAPRLFGGVLNSRQKFAAAKQMQEHIFNPACHDTADSSYYWRFLPLKQAESESLQKNLINAAALSAYQNDPFDPHAIAQLRLSAYQKAVVMDYVANLMDWGDMLFRAYTRESLNEARMLYILACDILGKRPENLKPYELPKPMHYQELVEKGYTISEFLVQLENHASNASACTMVLSDTPSNYLVGLYFGIPENQGFIAFFDRVEDRLAKMRSGLTIDGVAAKLPLFQPPLNPLAVVEALARGEGLDSSTLPSAETPRYRFRALLEKARTFASQVIEFGSSLLAALEKKDSAQLEELRASQEQILQTLSLTMKEEQINAAIHSKAALQSSLDSAQARLKYYTEILQTPVSPEEKNQLEEMKTAQDWTEKSRVGQIVASTLHAIPQSGSPFAMTYGGQELGSVADAVAGGLGAAADRHNCNSTLASLTSSWQRRAEEWTLQKKMAELDIDQFQRQLEGAETQITIASQEYVLLQKQITQAEAVANFLTTRFTNQELYQWIVRRMSAVYYQAYQLALALAQQCQAAFEYELDTEPPCLQAAPWDNFRHGLTSGEVLMSALMQMEKAYLDKNERRFEIQKIISFKSDKKEGTSADQASATLSESLENLKQGGKCDFYLKEEMFKSDFPNHHNRKLKSLSISFPALLGPYQNICAELKYTGTTTIQKENPAVANFLKGNLPLTAEVRAGVSSMVSVCKNIAISRGINDSGVFEFSFEDERYLPFEGIGLQGTSSWTLEITNAAKDKKEFLDKITDVVLTLYYTAKL